MLHYSLSYLVFHPYLLLCSAFCTTNEMANQFAIALSLFLGFTSLPFAVFGFLYNQIYIQLNFVC